MVDPANGFPQMGSFPLVNMGKLGPIPPYTRAIPGQPDEAVTEGPSPNFGVCPSCKVALEIGDFYTLVPVGPGPNEDERRRMRNGLPLTRPSAIVVCWPCVSGQDRKSRIELV